MSLYVTLWLGIDNNSWNPSNLPHELFWKTDSGKLVYQISQMNSSKWIWTTTEPCYRLTHDFFFNKLPEQKNLILPKNRKRPAPFALRYFISWKLINIGTNLISSTADAICSLWNIYKCLLHQIVREIVLLFVNNVHEKTSEGVKTVEILKACARYL